MTTNYGKREIVKYMIMCLLTIVFCLLMNYVLWDGFVWLVVVPIIEFIFVMYFFRDPERKIVYDNNKMFAPADGVVTHIEEVEDPGFIGEKALRISIFLSILDVHINRIAYPGIVKYIKYKKGEFRNAMSSDSLFLNEYNDIGIETANSKMKKYLQRQIVGLIARRIVCDVNKNDNLQQGQRYGMMKFGSRTDLYIPISSCLNIKTNIGQKVLAGVTILVEI